MVQTLMKKDKVVCKLYLAEARDGIQKFSKLFFFFQRYAAFFYDLTDELVRERNTEYRPRIRLYSVPSIFRRP